MIAGISICYMNGMLVRCYERSRVTQSLKM